MQKDRLLAVSATFAVAALVGGGSAPLALATGSPPRITSVSPNAGKVGKRVVITGKHFGNLRGVYFGGIQAYAAYTSTRITASVPAGCSGKVKISVVTTNGYRAQPHKFNCLPG